MKAILTRISSNHKNLRDDVVEGDCAFEPMENASFCLTAPSRDFEGGVRMITTSRVMELKKTSETEFEFKTMNSHYKLKLI